MDKQQALEYLHGLALNAELPKGTTAVQATEYIKTINQAKTVLESIIKTEDKSE